MVSCFYCMRPLPDGCICPITFREKKMRYIDSALRELLLIKKVYDTELKWKPKVMLNGRLLNEDEYKVKEINTGIAISLQMEKNRDNELIVFDAEDKALYREIVRKEDLDKRGKKTVLTWKFGWETTMYEYEYNLLIPEEDVNVTWK